MSSPPSNASPALPTRSQRRGERTRERILDAAEEHFAERGFEGAHLRDVASRVGIRNPSLYNHFASKESLYAAVLERGVGPVLGLLSMIVETEAPVRIDSQQLVEQVMSLLEQRPHLPRLILRETLSGGQRLTPMLRAWIAPIFQHAHEMIEAQPAARAWSRDQIPLLVLALYHIVVGYHTIAPLYKDLNDEDLLTPEARARQTRFLVEVVERLLPDENSAPADEG
jgi:AcrR family transcriptional regulator